MVCIVGYLSVTIALAVYAYQWFQELGLFQSSIFWLNILIPIIVTLVSSEDPMHAVSYTLTV